MDKTSAMSQVEVVGPERRRRYTVAEKLQMVEATYEPGMSVSYVARVNGVAPNLLFKWRKLYREGALASVKTGDEVVPASQVAQLEKQVRELQRTLGKKTQEAEILKEALEVAQRKKLLSRSPWPPEDDSR